MLEVMNRELYEISYVMKKELQRRIVTIILFSVAIFTGITLVLIFLLFPIRQESVSMQPDIVKSAYVLFTPVKTVPERGSVVLLKPLYAEKKNTVLHILNHFCLFFTAQQYSLLSDKGRMGSNSQIRRIIGLPGDTLYLKNYIAYVKPAGEKHFLTEFELVDKSYNLNITSSPSGWEKEIGVSGDYQTIILGTDEYFALGDNRKGCMDSRLWGPVNGSRIQACALAEYFPFSHFRLF
jgi:signal peptidase I